jgi:hypothetical protein
MSRPRLTLDPDETTLRERMVPLVSRPALTCRFVIRSVGVRVSVERVRFVGTSASLLPLWWTAMVRDLTDDKRLLTPLITQPHNLRVRSAVVPLEP